MQKLTGLLLTTVVTYATFVEASAQQDHFRQCFCWNVATDSFCGGDKFFDQHACKSWLLEAFAWSIPALIGLLILLFLPFVFFCSRCFCGCCGGRYSTEGCCCADESTRGQFRGYSNRTIFVAKGLMLCIFGGYIYYAVGGYESNSHLTTDINGAIGLVNETVNGAETQIQTAQSSLLALMPTGAATQEDIDEVALYGQRFAGRAKQIRNIVHDLHDVENNESWGRKESVYRYPSCVIFVLTLIVLFMVCNCPKMMVPLFTLYCLSSFVEGVVFVPHMIFAQATSSICDNYNETVVPMTVGAIESQHGCGNARVQQMTDNIANWVQSEWWTPGSSFCQNFDVACSALDCPVSTCVASSSEYPSRLPLISFDPQRPYEIQNLYTALTATRGPNASASVVYNATNVLECAQYCADATVRAAASQVVASFQAYYPAASSLLTDVFPELANCTYIRRQLQGPIYQTVCDHALNMRATSVALVLGMMYLISFLGLPVVARGLKRFVAMKRGQTIAQVAVETVYYIDTRVCAVDVSEQEPVNSNDTERALLSTNPTCSVQSYGTDPIQKP